MGALLSTIMPSTSAANESATMNGLPARKRAAVGEDSLERIDGTGAVNDLPDSLVEQILIRVHDRTLQHVCTLVCQQWKRIIEDNQFWLQKCRLAGLTLPPIVTEHSCDYRKVYLKNPYGRNLIRNPSGEKELQHWKLVLNGGDGWVVEKPPIGADVDGFPSCFATSYGWCIKRQLIDLKSLGVDDFVMDKLKPVITISEWHAARFDCASDYILDVFLGNFESALPVPTEFSFPQFLGEDEHDDHDPRLVYYQMAPRTKNELEDAENFRRLSRRFGTNAQHYQLFHVLAKFNVQCHVEQWAGRRWEEAHGVFSNYPAGARHVILKSSGKDSQFWAGHYGPKMAKASVTLSF